MSAASYACNAATYGARAATLAYSYVKLAAPVAAATDAPRAVTPAATSTAKKAADRAAAKAADRAATRKSKENQALAKEFITNLRKAVINHISLISDQIAKLQPAGR